MNIWIETSDQNWRFNRDSHLLHEDKSDNGPKGQREREKSWESYYQRNNAKNFVVEGKHKTSN